MSKPDGFLQYGRESAKKRAIAERINDFAEIEIPYTDEQAERQAARCMECGTPFCHACGCPIYNVIPDWTELLVHNKYRFALDLIHSTNNFPEFTGRLCPAMCEASCALAVNGEAVSIRQLELYLCEMGWREGWIRSRPASVRSGRRVAVVGSGPAGLAAAQQLARMGHKAVVFESDDRIGGFLRYGIPDFKLDKNIIDRRLEQLKGENIEFETGVKVGVDLSIDYLRRTFDAILLASGSRTPRDINIPGRDLKGIHFAVDYLSCQNRKIAGDTVTGENDISAAGKRVVVIGGGDTGSDCVGTAVRQGASSIFQMEILPEPPACRDSSTPWPMWPKMLRSSTSHEEGGKRRWSSQTSKFFGKDGHVAGLNCIEIEWRKDIATGEQIFSEKPGTGFTLEADLVLLATGFIKKSGSEILSMFGVVKKEKAEIPAFSGRVTCLPGVFIAGDLYLGPSLVARAIADGRDAAEHVGLYLKGRVN